MESWSLISSKSWLRIVKLLGILGIWGKYQKTPGFRILETWTHFSFVFVSLCFHFQSIFWTLWSKILSALHVNCFRDQPPRHMSKESKSWLLLIEITIFLVCLPTNSTPDIQSYKQRRSVQNNLAKASNCSNCIPNATVAPNWKHERWGSLHHPSVALQILVASERTKK